MGRLVAFALGAIGNLQHYNDYPIRSYVEIISEFECNLA